MSSLPPFETSPDAPDDAVLSRWLTGQCTPEERSEIEAWAARDDEHGTFLNLLRSGYTAAGRPMLQGDLESALRRLRGHMAARAPGRSEGDAIRRAWRSGAAGRPEVTRKDGSSAVFASVVRRARYAIVGVLAAVLTIGVVKTAAVARHGEGAPPRVTVYTTRPGQRADITLSDGSTVTLNVASRLEVPSDFGAEKRVVRLSYGEALFTVSHRGGAPFTVNTGTTSARVLGTSFVVRNYATDTAVVVAVRDGKVAVRSMVLTAGRRADMGRDGGIHVGEADGARFTFATGVLTLDQVPLKDAAVELGRWYDADVRVADPVLAAHRVQGTFAAGSLTDLVSILGLTFDARVVRNGRVITLYPRL